MQIELNKYLGMWHEIAKIENAYEPNLTHVSANYTMNEDGNIKITNSGWVNGKMVQINGVATKGEGDDTFKVSFSCKEPSVYKILAIDKNYHYALIGGGDANHLWILARTEQIPRQVYNQFIQIAEKHGYNVAKLMLN